MFRLKIICFLLILAPSALKSATDCSKLRVGQFLCPDPESDYIDEKTQSVIGNFINSLIVKKIEIINKIYFKGCTREGKAIGELTVNFLRYLIRIYHFFIQKFVVWLLKELFVQQLETTLSMGRCRVNSRNRNNIF